eukprot:TRINITY_DN16435_c0_g1_i1.p1 TRINITY_DN16435_c0_g1~~TRINITY_DN16435_c0_g1_i1.p1  ORF type:complete len:483 (+),score=68.56 TRINITY_DN16435_c0_g1_i1:49-1497(+)
MLKPEVAGHKTPVGNSQQASSARVEEIVAMEKTARIGDRTRHGKCVGRHVTAALKCSGKVPRRGLQLGGFVFLVGVLVSLSSGSAQTDVSPVKGAYWFMDDTTPESIPSQLYTHLFFAFADLNSSSFQVVPGSHDVAEALATFSATVKVANPFVKTLISIGGGDSDREAFANMTSKPALRSVFINSSIALARENGFDGLDLDYEFPDSDERMANFSDFLDDWRNGVTAEAKATSRTPLLLTAAVYYASSLIFSVANASFPVSSIIKNLDFVNLMLYDLHGRWDETQVNYNAPLFAPSSVLSGSYGVRTWLTAGLPPSKAVFGIPAYGYSWILADKSKNTIGSAAIGLGPHNGIFTYKEVAEFITQEGVTAVYDNENVSSYAYNATGVWVGYDGPQSVSAKVLYAKQLNLRGYFFWAVGFDDSKWSLSESASRTLDGLAPSEEPALAPAPAPSSSASSLHGTWATAGLFWLICLTYLSNGGVI